MTTENNTQPSHLEMSDDDFLKAPTPEVTTPTADEVVPPAAEATSATEDGDDQVIEAGAEASTTDEGGLKDEVEGAAADAGAAEASKAATGDEGDKPAEEKPATGDDKEKPAEEPVVVNYQAEYERLMKPFKANGREVKIDSVDDAISLMQMGANYNKKMAGLKPSLSILKLLENNQLLDPAKLSYLIDLDKKDPAAINKLIKDSGINPMDLSAEKASEYEPKTHLVDEREIDLDTVLDEIQDTPTYNQVLTLVSKKWDGASKQVVAAQPQLLKVLNEHMANGVYDLISTEVERERVFGRLNGLSDIEAYRKVGDAINARGGFSHLGKPQGPGAKPEPVIVAPKPKVADSALNDKRRAASAAPAAAPAAATAEFNPLSMSDEDFAKAAVPRFK